MQESDPEESGSSQRVASRHGSGSSYITSQAVETKKAPRARHRGDREQ